jgi:arylamine N-acetyltransferase
VPYETVDLVAGRPPGIEPRESAERVVSGRGGYCYQLNEAFSWLLRELGYDVVRHVAGVSYSAERTTGADGNHPGLTVRGLPDAQCPDGTWLVDVELGRPDRPVRAGAAARSPRVDEISALEPVTSWAKSACGQRLRADRPMRHHRWLCADCPTQTGTWTRS